MIVIQVNVLQEKTRIDHENFIYNRDAKICQKTFFQVLFQIDTNVNIKYKYY